MGWFWQSSSPSPKPAGGASDSPAPTSTTPAPPAATPPPPAAQTPPAEPADREMAMFMDMLMKDTKSSSSSIQQQPQQPQTQQPPSPSSTTSSTSWLTWSSKSEPPSTPQPETDQPHPPHKTRSAHSLAMSEHTLPTTLSCRDAFDYAWHCHTPGAQWNAVYRYGSVRPCTELWDDFWFCMRTKSYSPEMRAEAIREHYRAKEEAKYGGGRPSSEDIWESREDRVAPGTAFRTTLEPLPEDAELQRLDAERRRRVREEMDRRDNKNKE